jgi:hypothetical protein
LPAPAIILAWGVDSEDSPTDSARDFSDEFTDCFEDFIGKLHGVPRPMFLVPADLLRFSVEMALRKFFRMVRSVKGSSLPDQLSLKTPALCVDYLKTLFAKIAVSQSDFLTMQRHRTIGSTGRGEKKRCKRCSSYRKEQREQLRGLSSLRSRRRSAFHQLRRLRRSLA